MENKELYEAMIAGFNKLDQRINLLENKFNKLDQKINLLDQKFTKKFRSLEIRLGLETEDRAKAFLRHKIKKQQKIAGEQFYYSTGNYTIWGNHQKPKAEYDDILVNGKAIGIVEMKTTLTSRAIKNFLDGSLKEFLSQPSINIAQNQVMDTKGKDYILIFMCRFLSEKEKTKIAPILKEPKQVNKIVVLQEDPYRDFIEVK